MASETPDEEPFGTTPLPTSTADIGGTGAAGSDDPTSTTALSSPVEIVLDMDPIVDPVNGIAQQPQTQQIIICASYTFFK